MRDGMGLGISHRGGPVTAATVAGILKYFEGRLAELQVREVDAAVWYKFSDYLAFWRVDGPVSKFEAESIERHKESERTYYAEVDPEHFKARPMLLTPLDFVPTMQRGIRAILDPNADTLSIVFTQNGSKDEWRDLGAYTKTSHLDPWPGLHVTICEILQDIQRIVKSAGGDFEISDECDYCDDYSDNLEKLRHPSADESEE